jgi:putative membrane protein
MVLQFRSVLRNEDAIKPIKSYCLKRITLCKEPQTHTQRLISIACKDLYKVLKEKRITTYQQVEIDNTLTRLCMRWENVNELKHRFPNNL